MHALGLAPAAATAREAPGGRVPDLAAKVAWLSDARNYPEVTEQVQAVETHRSWVFLTDRFAYKLKKPERFDHHDLSTLEARRQHARREIALNRRLTEGVYLDSVPLTLDDGQGLRLGGYGAPVEWLVWMRRLPRKKALDWLVMHDRVPEARLREAVGLLGRHYRLSRPEALTGAQWRKRLAATIDANLRQLAPFGGLLALERLKESCARQHAFLAHESALFDARAAAGRIVEGHGDLRPEHVFLEARPQIIDCLEFSRELRVADVAAELGFLALECERLGDPRLRAVIFDAYADVSGDRPPECLVEFHQSVHALVRARLALDHLRDPVVRDTERWSRQGRACLDLAAAHIERCPRSTRAAAAGATLAS